RGSEAPNQPPFYGNEHDLRSANYPGARRLYASWKDVYGMFWSFGGQNYNGDNLADMWEYDPFHNVWAWMSGSQIVNDPGNYGPRCTSSTAFYPQARTENRVRWTDNCNRFWMYGGNYINDLWCFDPMLLKWTFINGSDTTFALPVYGTRGVPNA